MMLLLHVKHREFIDFYYYNLNGKTYKQRDIIDNETKLFIKIVLNYIGIPIIYQ